MIQYFSHLTLPFEPAMKEFSVFENDRSKLGHVRRSLDLVDPRLLALLDDLGMQVSHGEAFYTPPLQKLAIHVDTGKFGDFAKLNFCFGGGLMNWWALNDPTFEPEVRLTGIDTKYIFLPITACHLVASTAIRRPTLVNVGRPHSVINTTHFPRYVGSLMLSDKTTNQQLDMAEASDRLGAYANL